MKETEERKKDNGMKKKKKWSGAVSVEDRDGSFCCSHMVGIDHRTVWPHPPPPPPPPHPEGVTLPLLESPSLAATVPACLCGRRHAVCASQRVKQTGIGSGVCVCAWTWLCLAFLGAEMGGRLGFKMTIWQKNQKNQPKKPKPWWTGRKSIWKCLECLFFFIGSEF